MNTRISVRSVILLVLILVAIFYSVLSYQAQVETPLWMLQYTFYAFMTAIFGFIFLGILAPLFRNYLEERKTRKTNEIAILELLRGEYERCAWSIGNNLDNYVKKNKMTDFVARLEARDDFWRRFRGI